MAARFDRTMALWRRTPAWARRATVLAASVLVAWAAALAVVNRPASRARLRLAIREAVARRLPGAELGDSVSVDPLFRVTFGPLTLAAEREGAPPVLRAAHVKVRASWTSLLGGRLEPASVRLYGLRLVAGERLAELRLLAERLSHRADPRTPPGGAAPRAAGRWPAIHLRGAVVVLRHEGRDVELGPIDATLTRRRHAGDDDVELSAALREGGTLRASLHRGGDGYRLRAGLIDLTPDALPAPFAERAVRWSGGTFSGELSISARPGEPGSGRMRARLDRAYFAGERLSPEPVGPLTFDLDGAVEADPSRRRLALRGGALRLLGAADGALDAEVTLGPGLPFSLAFDLPAVDYGALEEALPEALRPPAEAPHPSGPFSFRFAVAGPIREPAAWTVEAGLDLSRLREAARRAPPVALRSAFTWRPEVETGEAPALRVGPENPAFVPLAELPEHVVRAVTTSEDAGFFAHPGFDFEELKNAFAQGAEAGRMVRGASTLTQQLAKNLYLSREKTLVRKAREAMVAIGLEATVSKARLLEIYLNIAEWGPGLWGIGPAAQHYFGKPARELTVREAVFLASIIPNPVRYHGYYTRGELDEAWEDRLRTLLLHMAGAGAISEEQLLEALEAPLAFTSRTAFLGQPAAESGVPPGALETEAGR